MFARVLASLLLLSIRNIIAELFNDSYDTLRCEKAREHLFDSVREIDEFRFEWERYLPVYVKLTLHARDGVKVDNHKGTELEFEYGHDRFDLLGPIGPSCKHGLESYGAGDEEKKICGLQKLNALSSQQNGNDDCVIYSLGSNNTWGFETSIVEKTNCRVETFDCTVPPETQPPSSIANRVRFHHVCVSDSDFEADGRQFYSWKSLNRLTGIKTSPTFLKMDVEGYEFPILRSIIDAGEYLPLQIATEFHYKRWEKPWNDRRASGLELYTYFQYLHRYGGYYLIDRRDNQLCLHCTEVLLAKLNCQNYPMKKSFADFLESKPEIAAHQNSQFLKRLQNVVHNKYYG